MHLQELVRMVFIAATAICDQLKLEGLSTLQVQVHVKYVCSEMLGLLIAVTLKIKNRAQ